jgi:nucleoid-associated protein YgaU
MSPEQRSMIDRSVDLSSHRTAVAHNDVAPGRIPQDVEPVAPDAAAQRAGISTVKSRPGAPLEIEGFDAVASESQQPALHMKDVRFHDVQGGESLFAICKDYYDDTSLVAALAQFNKMGDASQIRAGRRLMIPPASVLGGKTSALASNKAGPAESTSPSSALVKQTTEKPAKAGTDKPASPIKTYTVKSGDSLSSIAQRFLGDREKWRDLHKLNRKVIDDPDNLKVGTVIRLL